MVTKAKASIFKPKVIIIYMSKDLKPSTIIDALSILKCKQATDKNFNALIKKNIWALVSPPFDRKLIGCKWIFKRKCDS